MLNTIYKMSQSIRKLSHYSCRSVVIKFVRPNTSYTNVFRSQKQKKEEGGEAIKWILLMIPVTSFGLGCWQVYRLQWKLELIDMLQAKSNSVPVDMPTNFEALRNMEFLPVKVRGEFLHDREILIGPRALIEENQALPRTGSLMSDPKKNQGWLVITPFKISETGVGCNRKTAQGTGQKMAPQVSKLQSQIVLPDIIRAALLTVDVILVNRGWIPKGLRPKEKRQPSMVEGEVELTGVVRLTENRRPFIPKNHPEKGSWFYRDLHQMSAHLNCSPVWLDARGIPDPPEGWPIPNQTRVTVRNEHFSYLVTWYSLSALTAIMWHRYFIRKLPLI